MSLVQQCSCGKQFKASPTLAGKRVKCPSCGASVLIEPGESAADDAAAEEPARSKKSALSPVERKRRSQGQMETFGPNGGTVGRPCHNAA